MEVKWWGQRVKNIYHYLVSVVMIAWYRYPARKMFVIGVTGTDGKTTTATLIYEILRAAGLNAALISTVAAKIGGEEVDTGLHTTNPDARRMQPLLRRMADAGVTHLVLEVTAHGLDQYRVLGCNFAVGVLTNITHEHLDDFVTMERYRRAKLKLFKGVKFAVLNADDPSFKNFQFSIFNFKSNSKTRIIKYSKSKLKDISPALWGDYNRYNIGAAEAVARILEVRSQIVETVIKDFEGVPGRREEVKAGQKFRVIVDFAHTPNALDQVLLQLRKELGAEKRLILVFGCTGERDKGKRPMMGEIASRLADVVIITSDDMRSESQDEIARQIMSGITPELRSSPLKFSSPTRVFAVRGDKRGDMKIVKENDRGEAIKKAIKEAGPGDIVLLAGKGHERTILIGKTERPWSDAEEAKRAIRGAGG
ncbi:hypothetical protein A2354_03655 [Candidatus Amesbacteria bacterium RIFOXYB1_FULL_47_12]|nr:MAG: hypothetical protein A2354_03655 [Candidatus Amesbacteria bacterium RIFOXYB1_FULL_47_12]